MKIWIVLLAAILVGSNMYWFGRVLDGGITLARVQAAAVEAERSADIAVELANLRLHGLPVSDARQQIEQALERAVAFEQADGCLYVEDICVQVDAGGTISAIARE